MVSVKWKNGKYRTYINVDKKQIHLGVFDTLDEAKKTRDGASLKYYGEFANLLEYMSPVAKKEEEEYDS